MPPMKNTIQWINPFSSPVNNASLNLGGAPTSLLVPEPTDKALTEKRKNSLPGYDEATHPHHFPTPKYEPLPTYEPRLSLNDRQYDELRLKVVAADRRMSEDLAEIGL